MMKSLAFVSIVALFGCTYPTLGPADCSVESTYTSVLSSVGAFNEGSGATWADELRFEGTLNLDPDIEVDILIYGGGGSASTPAWPASLGPSSNTPVSLKSLDAYVDVATNFGSDGTPADLYLPISGTLNVTSAGGVGQTMSGTYSDVVLAHGTISSSGDLVPDKDGCMTTVSGSYSATIQAVAD